MNERQRMQYLEALGVDSFVPRRLLPGARRSTQCALPVAADTRLVSERSSEEHTPPRKPVGALVDSLLADQSKRQSAEEGKTRIATPADAPAAAPQEKAAFSLAFWRVHPKVMVIDSRQPKALPTEALLRSLILALGLGSALPRGEVQNWPLPGISDVGWDAARETMQAFLESRLLSQPVHFLVLMGEEAARAVLPAEVDPDSARVPLHAFACDALLTPSLADLLLNPQKKALTWRLLTPLRHELNER